ncbi:MAG: sugar ABC transporter permease [Microbacterium sp.]|uniref:carbohydrate ABC transporter permease n=1 Tax=Microbacterium sp. TaxID=51671 RepID=UPI001ACCC225|nr:sugar ABC transporter permease [Microbacterium sp.]MBN9154056.1 sugar ABC transporter permease [Microbacterium sp.]MBN9175315.1 sugar ABC transporter permease [Microbacterium sp.]MBN9182917.1 sugar ABC transporter permease [Microbacterium sp.]MBN9184295.1 sugar ABC transporter permease [Microbacterium sp.]MBN9187381.1 sugar ABC transporter permease [Microbacterium sp.]
MSTTDMALPGPLLQQEVPIAPTGRRRRRRNPPTAKHLRSNVTAYLMIAPMGILLAIFVIWPLIYAVYLSLFKINFYKPAEFVGLQFYLYVLQSEKFWKSIGVGLYYVVLTVPAGLVISLLVASFIKTLSKKAAGWMKTTVYIPAAISTVVASVLFVFIYQDQGFANWFLGLVNLGPVNWLNDPSLALPAIAVPGIWLGFGVTTLIMLAGLLDIPDSYYESAELDGANWFQRTWFITIPLLKNVSLYLLVTGVVAAIQMLDLPLIMTNGGPVDATTTPNLFIFNSFRDGTPYATSFSLTAALLLFVVLGTISAVIFRLINSDKAVDG